MTSQTQLEVLFPKECFGCIIGAKGKKVEEIRTANNVKIQNEKEVVKGGFR